MRPGLRQRSGQTNTSSGEAWQRPASILTGWTLRRTVLFDTPTEGGGRFHRASWLMCLPHYQHL